MGETSGDYGASKILQVKIPWKFPILRGRSEQDLTHLRARLRASDAGYAPARAARADHAAPQGGLGGGVEEEAQDAE